MTYQSINGKLVKGKFQHTIRNAPAGYSAAPDAFVQQMAQSLLKQYADPNSSINKMTAELRAKGVPCMKDDLDRGADIYELCRNSVFIQTA